MQLKSQEQIYRVYMDGNSWCTVGKEFTNIQESNIAFGNSPVNALDSLIKIEQENEIQRRKLIRYFRCQCGMLFGVRCYHDRPNCPKNGCAYHDQYTREIAFSESEFNALLYAQKERRMVNKYAT